VVLPCSNAYDARLSVIFSSEGVQIGGIASAFGVIGAWTGARHDSSKCI
jgi:hypothetical protein